ncbi:unnamed protein product [Caenorhabditis brenneri]
MKISLGILILVFALVHLGNTFMVGGELDTSAFIKGLNGLRLKMSQEGKISNMNELSWDDNLVTKADKLECDNGNDDGPTFNVMALPTENDMEKFSGLSEEEAKMKMIEGFIVPVHSKVGCTKHRCGREDRFFCAFSPKFDMSKKLSKKGRPGTECASGSNKDGLCKPGPSESAEAIETPEHRSDGPEVDRKMISGGPKDDRRTNEMKANFDSASSPSNLKRHFL